MSPRAAPAAAPRSPGRAGARRRPTMATNTAKSGTRAPGRTSTAAPKSARGAAGAGTTPAAKPARKSVAKTASAKATTPKTAAARTAPKTAAARATVTAPVTPPAARAKTRGATKARTRTAGHRKISAGEVEYSANLFRSKLEMRWCAFFDLMGIDYDYEPCWYRVGPDLRYTPDIYLPGLGLWAEVKGPDYLDAASWAKIAAAVAGPAPLPAREHPYTASTRMLLLGPMDREMSTDPAIGLVQRLQGGTAGIFRARIQGAGTETRFVADESPLETVAATGVAAARRPVEKVRAKVLLPAPYPEATEVGASARLAYRAAAGLRVDDTRRALAHDNDPEITVVLGLRRGGRPLPASPWPGT